MDGIHEVASAPSDEDSTQWHEKHGIKPASDGWIDGLPDGKTPLPDDKLMENVAVNALRHDVPNLEHCVYRSSTMVFVGGGPSAAEFIAEIRAKSKKAQYEIYCSNATAAWLLSHGITPKYQVIIDPKPSKAADVAHRNPDITYLLSLNCDPSVFDAVQGLKVFKFLASSARQDGQKDTDVARAACTPTDPRLVVIGGGTMMGTRAFVLANPLGYRGIEYYGFDGDVRLESGNVKCYAYDKPRGEAIIEVEAEDGRKFDSTMTFARQAGEINFFRKMLPWIDITIHGDGFIAHMLKLDRAKEASPAAYRCSDEYRELQRQMADSYEGAGRNYAQRVFLIVGQMLKVYGPIEVLDYGCGKRALERAITEGYVELPGLTFRGYNLDDPDPEPADLVTCTDVMEHVEPECVEAVLDHIQSLARRHVFFAIDTQPALKDLPDGRNAHICLRPNDYWYGQLMKRFIVVENYNRGETLFYVGHSFPKETPHAPERYGYARTILARLTSTCRRYLRWCAGRLHEGRP